MSSSRSRVDIETEITVEGELSCVIMYSEKRHVEYIYPLLSQIESLLRDKGFRPQRLGSEIRSGEDYLNKLEEMIEDCVLGIVILDGFRPNVLFEFGFLKGKKKPTIILQSKGAYISLKTLYKSTEDSGLREDTFKNRLKGPPIDVTYHFSDFAGKHIGYIDWTAKETEPDHPSVILANELEKYKNQIFEETRKVKTRNMPSDLPSSSLQEFLQPLMDIIKYYYADASEFDTKELERAYSQLRSIGQKYKFQVPADIYSMIAATYVSKAREMLDATEIMDHLNSAINIYREILESTSVHNKPVLYADTQKKIGDAYLQGLYYTAGYAIYKEISEGAIKAYKEALRVYTLESSPTKYAEIQNNIGEVYRLTVAVEDWIENANRAIEASEEALRVYTLQSFPSEYAKTHYNLGIGYRALAVAEDYVENLSRSLKAFEEALKVYTLEESSREYGRAQLSFGKTCAFLGVVKDRIKNCSLAIKSCERALRVFSPENDPYWYVHVQLNLAYAFAHLAEVEDRTGNCNRAIEACEEALKIVKPENRQYPVIQQHLAIAYTLLAEVEDRTENCSRAIGACEEAIKDVDFKDELWEFPITHRILGDAYRILAEVEDRARNCGRALEAYDQALRKLTFESFPTDYAKTQNSLGKAYRVLAEVKDRIENCARARKAYEEALRVFTKEEYSEVYSQVDRNLRELANFCDSG
ncbi:MAG: hypothetical protein ACFE7E_06980 [Candidatus Hodarchaeota archaeon]